MMPAIYGFALLGFHQFSEVFSGRLRQR